MHRISFFIVFVTLSLTSVMTGQDIKEKYASLLKIRWEVSSVKETYLPLEPLQIKFKFTNTSVLPTRLGDGFGLDLYITHKNKTVKFEQLSYVTGDGVFVPVIEPNESVEIFRLQDFNSAKMFPEYGKYELTFVTPYSEFGSEIKEFKTNTFSINISEPSGLDKEAYEFLRRYDNRQLFYGLAKSEESEVLYKLFAEQYGQSVYGEYAVENLVSLYLIKGELDKAQLEYEKIKFSENPFIMKRANSLILDIKRKKDNLKKEN